MNKVEKKFDLNDFISKNKAEKGSYILEKSKKILVPKTIHHNLKEAYKRKEFINTFIKDYINLNQNTEKEIKENIQNKIKLFKDDYINIKLPKLMSSKKNSLFLLCDANIFRSAQTISRSVSTTMGMLWEMIATCSNNAISTEEEFGIKITGVDAIGIIDDKPTYIQLKTAEDTLTGGHCPRSEMELSIHDYSFFGTAFKTGSTWHFKSEKIKKYAGEDFWVKLNLDYSFIFDQIKPMILEIENKYVELRDTKI
jgi:hypothetical protein